MDKDLIHVLEKIANGIEESNDILNRIANHYDGVVPVMTRNANRVEKAHMEVEEDNLLTTIKEAAAVAHIDESSAEIKDIETTDLSNKASLAKSADSTHSCQYHSD